MDPSTLVKLPMTFYNFGLLDRGQLDMVQPLTEAFEQDIAANRSFMAKDVRTLKVPTL